MTKKPEIKGNFSVSLSERVLDITGTVIIDGSIRSNQELHDVFNRIAHNHDIEPDQYDTVNADTINITGNLTLERANVGTINYRR